MFDLETQMIPAIKSLRTWAVDNTGCMLGLYESKEVVEILRNSQRAAHSRNAAIEALKQVPLRYRSEVVKAVKDIFDLTNTEIDTITAL